MKKSTSDNTFFNMSFTVVEFVVIVAIISLVAGLTVSKVRTAVVERRDERRVADLGLIQKGLVMYYAQYGAYPIGIARSDSLCWRQNENGSSCHPLGVLHELGFVSQVPTDPGANARVSNDACDGNQFYSYKSDGNSYTLGAVKEASNGSCSCKFEWGSYENCLTGSNGQ